MQRQFRLVAVEITDVMPRAAVKSDAERNMAVCCDDLAGSWGIYSKMDWTLLSSVGRCGALRRERTRMLELRPVTSGSA